MSTKLELQALLDRITTPEEIDPETQRLQSVLDSIVAPTFWDRVRNAGHSFVQGLESVPESLAKSHAIASEAIHDWMFPDYAEDQDVSDYRAYRAAEWMDRITDDLFPEDPRLADEWLSSIIPQGLGQVGATVGTGVAGRVLSIPGFLVAGSTGAIQQGTEEYDRAYQAYGNEELAIQSAISGGVVGTTEALPMGRLIGRIDDAFGGKFVSTLRGILASAAVQSVEEGVQETVQQLGSNAVQRAYNADKPLWEGLASSGGQGAVIGGLADTILSIGLRLAGGRGLPVRVPSPDLPVGEAGQLQDIVNQVVDQPVSRETKVSPATVNAPTTKGELVSEAGARWLVQANPDGAQRLAARRQPTRQQVADATGLGRDAIPLSRDERAELVRLVKSQLKGEPSATEEVIEQEGPPGQREEAGERGLPSETGRGDRLQRPEEVQGQEEAEEVARESPRKAAKAPSFDAVVEEATRTSQRPPEALGAVSGPIVGGVKRQQGKTYLDDLPPEARRRIEAARGVKGVRPLEAFRAFGQEVKKLFRAQKEIPNTPEFATANEFFRLAKIQPRRAQEDAYRINTAVAEMLPGKYEHDLLSDHFVIENELVNVSAGRPLRFGFKSVSELRKAQKAIAEAVSESPSVQAAIERRRKTVVGLVQSLQEAKLLPENLNVPPESYYHQQVRDFVELGRSYNKLQKKVARKAGGLSFTTKASFQRARSTSEKVAEEAFDYNTAIFEADADWLVDAIRRLRDKQLFERFIVERYHAPMKERLQTEAEQAKDEGREVDWRDLVPDGWTLWRIPPGHRYAPVATLNDRILDHLMSGELEGTELTPEQVKIVRATFPTPEYVIPVELANQFESMATIKEPSVIGDFYRTAASAMKTWFLNGPKALAKFITRQTTGNIDRAFAGAVDMTPAEIWRAYKELSTYYKNGVETPELHAALEHGVLDSSMSTEDILRIAPDNPYLKFYANALTPMDVVTWPARAPWRLTKAYFDWARRATTVDEAVFRYAAWKQYQKKLKRGEFYHYGGAKKGIVEALRSDLGDQVAAGHLAREVQGDYGNLSVMGEWLRRNLMWFFGWTETTAKFYPRVTLNAWEAGKLRGKDNAFARTVYTAMYGTRIIAFYAMMQLWNNLMFPDIEEDLSTFDRFNPHINFGRGKDGRAYFLRNVGALGDFLELFGINTLINLYPRYAEGRLTAADLAKEMGKDTAAKHIQAVQPFIKGIVELISGQSYFPTPFQPRSVDRMENLASNLGARDELLAVRGALTGSGERARPEYFSRWFVDQADPRPNALHEIRDLANQYLRSIGEATKESHGQSMTKTMRTAVEADDWDAFLDARAAFKASGKTYDQFKASIQHNIQIVPAKHLKGFLDWLNPIQRDKYEVAKYFGMDVETTLWYWYNAASAAQDTAAERKDMRQEVREEFDRLQETIDRGIERQPDENIKEFRERQEERRVSRETARRRLRERRPLKEKALSGIGPDQQ